MTTVVIIDYGAGNLHSAAKSFERAARESETGHDIVVSSAHQDVANAERIVLPGVGAFADCMAGLQAVAGMREALEQAVRRDGKPFLGICVGMQLMATRGLEHGVHEGLGWIDGDVEAIKPADPALKIPHMGWNTLERTGTQADHAILDGIKTGPDGLHAYFVHSYHMKVLQPGALAATTDYGMAISALIAKDNMIGTQFHPEKSQKLGLKLIANFLNWTP